MLAPPITDDLIHSHTSSESFRRGQEYQRDGRVISLVRRGNVLEAEVEGSAPEPYLVRVEFAQGDAVRATCNCPYSFGDWCKHIVASLLTCVDQPELINERPTLAELLTDLDREQFATLLFHLAESDPDLVDAIDRATLSLQYRTTASSQNAAVHVKLDPERTRRRVHAALWPDTTDRGRGRGRGYRDYPYIGPDSSQLDAFMNEATAFVQAGDGANALALLESLTDEYMATLDMTLNFDEDGDYYTVLQRLGATWTDTLLSVDLSPTEREEWADKLDVWLAELGDRGIEDAFEAAWDAARQGWDYPLLVRILKGDFSQPGMWEDEIPYWADDLTLARLNVLERQGRFQEYLFLAEAEGQTKRHATMLVRLGRVAEAIDFGLRNLASADDTLPLALALAEASEMDQALRIAEHGLTLDGPKSALALWLREQAVVLGQTDRAIRAAVAMFEESPGLDSYLRIQEIDGAGWPERRTALLKHLHGRHGYYPVGPVDIYLHEKMWDDAIAAVKHNAGHQLIEHVVEAVVETHPDWVIETSRKQAESIMDQGMAPHYHDAARWLGYARESYRIAGRDQEWQVYLAGQISRHTRKYKLRPMLEGLAR